MICPTEGTHDELHGDLEEIERLYAEGDTDAAWDKLEEARRGSPADDELRVWSGVLLLARDDPDGALVAFDKVLQEHPDHWAARLEHGYVLSELGRFEEALEDFKRVEEAARTEMLVPEMARLLYGKALCLDRADNAEAADHNFFLAAALLPEEFQRPPRLPPAEFQTLVETAIDSVPEELRKHLRQVMLAVHDYPQAEQAEIDPFLLGLYVGVPRPRRDPDDTAQLDHIFIFKRVLEIEFPERDELVEQIRRTVIHEVAHHFGLEEEDMGEYA